MKRRIIIITNAGKIGAENYCDGVFKDKDNYISFFKEAYGGYYSDSEIRHFDKPTKVKVRQELALLKNDVIEFSILIFCGHGWFSTISQSNIYQINDSEEIDSLEFRENANKRIIIEDNCRKPHQEYVTESLIKSFSVRALNDSTTQQLNPTECRLYYNRRISECPEQIICAQACDIGEIAGDSSSKGGYYSSSLLRQAVNTVESEMKTIKLSISYNVFSFPSCHNKAIPSVLTLSGNKQNPQIDKPRFENSSEYLPFAVIA